MFYSCCFARSYTCVCKKDNKVVEVSSITENLRISTTLLWWIIYKMFCLRYSFSTYR